MRTMTKAEEKAYSLAHEKWEQGDLRAAVRLFRTLAKTGDATALHALAHALSGDNPVPKRWKEVSALYRRAVRKGNALSAWNLALDYAARNQPRWQKYWLQVYVRMDKAGAQEELADWGNRLRARKKYVKALPYLELAARLGDVPAQNDCGIILETKVKPPRFAEAISWYRKAVKRGSKEAAHNLSLHYRDNENVGLRLQWLRTAAKMGHSGARSELRQLERARRRV